MRAILCTTYGPPEVLRFGELPKPTPKSNQVLIRVRAAAVTISDCIVRSGKVKLLMWLPMRIFVGFTRPRNPVLGLDLAGEVEAVGSAVRRFQVGDPVMAFTGNALSVGPLLDRLTHRCHIVEFKGESYRFRQSLERQQQLSEVGRAAVSQLYDAENESH